MIEEPSVVLFLSETWKVTYTIAVSKYWMVELVTYDSYSSSKSLEFVGCQEKLWKHLELKPKLIAPVLSIVHFCQTWCRTLLAWPVHPSQSRTNPMVSGVSPIPLLVGGQGAMGREHVDTAWSGNNSQGRSGSLRHRGRLDLASGTAPGCHWWLITEIALMMKHHSRMLFSFLFRDKLNQELGEECQ